MTRDAKRSNWAVLFAGGRGTRLGPITDALPKPMLPVAGRPLLEKLVLQLADAGIERVFIAVHYMADVIRAHFGDGNAFGCHIEYLNESRPLGTGGALSLLPAGASAPILALNGDLILDFDINALLAFHQQGGYRATMCVREYHYTIPFGVVATEGPRVVDLREKPTVTWQINAGVYVLEPSLIERVPRDVHFPLPALVEQSLALGESIGAYRIDGNWRDIGSPA